MNKPITPERLSNSENNKPERGGVSVSYGAPKTSKTATNGFEWKTFIRTFLMYFVGIYAVFAIYNTFIKKDNNVKKELAESGEVVSIKPMDSTLVRGNLPQWTINSNDTTATINLKPICDNGVNTATLDYWDNNKKVWIPILPSDFCSSYATNTQYTTPITLTSEHTKAIVSFPEITNTAFIKDGEYKLTLQKDDNTVIESSLVDISKPGILRTIFRYIVSKPLYNILLMLLTYMPGHNLLLAIVLLTILIRLILYPINTKALQNQIKLKDLQPELLRIQEEHKDNKQLQAMKTMMLYKDSGVSPLASIYPILIQFPILIGLYYIISAGLSPHLDYLRYSFLPSLDLSLVDKHLATLDLTQYSPWFIALGVAAIQYISFKFMMPQSPKPKDDDTSMQASMQSAMSTMQYVFPVIIGVMTLSVPAIVGIYWAFSTLLGALQQYVMTRLHTPKK